MDPAELSERYYVDPLAAFVRATLRLHPSASPAEAWEAAGHEGLRVHHFKRSSVLPRVQRVLGIIRGLGPTSLLDVGSGRGTALWPLLDTIPELDVLAIDRDPVRARELGLVHQGGITRLRAARMDCQQLGLADASVDGVTILEVLEHLSRPDLAAFELLRVARRFVIASVPSKPDTNPEHIRLFDRASFEQLWRDAGARRVQIEYVLNHAIAVAQK